MGNKVDYHQYLNSEAWTQKKLAFKQSIFYTPYCKACGESNGIYHIHHKTYRRLGNEYFSDLVRLCSDCHSNLHVLYKEKDLSLFTDMFIQIIGDKEPLIKYVKVEPPNDDAFVWGLFWGIVFTIIFVFIFLPSILS